MTAVVYYICVCLLAENEVMTDKIKSRVAWDIMRINHTRSRYIYDLMEREAISDKLYKYLLKHRYADANLIAKWKKQGYEKLCCVLCIQSRDNNDTKATCICRVPRAQLRDGQDIQCKTCGCRGCSSGD